MRITAARQVAQSRKEICEAEHKDRGFPSGETKVPLGFVAFI